jgi:hypothetical protein
MIGAARTTTPPLASRHATKWGAVILTKMVIIAAARSLKTDGT